MTIGRAANTLQNWFKYALDVLCIWNDVFFLTRFWNFRFLRKSFRSINIFPSQRFDWITLCQSASIGRAPGTDRSSTRFHRHHQSSSIVLTDPSTHFRYPSPAVLKSTTPSNPRVFCESQPVGPSFSHSLLVLVLVQLPC